jgi:hypothetical protein
LEEKMKFSIGNISIEITGDDRYCDGFKSIFNIVQNDAQPDIVYEFVEKISFKDKKCVPLDDFLIGEKTLFHKEKLFLYEIDWSDRPVKVFVAPRRLGFFKKSKKIINKNWRYFHTHYSTGFMHFFKRFVFYVYVPTLQLCAMKKGASFTHSSAIEKEGNAILFPAWGGIGKTGLMSSFLSEGWQFLSDDLCLIDEKGAANLHPLPMHLYKYHEIQNPELIQNMFKQLSFNDRLVWKIFGYVKKADRLVRWVNPEKVFGLEKISEEGKIAEVIHLHRHQNVDGFLLEEVSASELAGLMTSTILDEINNLASYSIIYNSVHKSDFIPDISDLYNKISSIYINGMSDSKCYKLSIPEKATTADTKNFLNQKKIIAF